MAVSYFVRMRAVAGYEQAVQDVLLWNMQRIRAGERGNLAFAVHRSRQDPREFWLYETWTDLDAVERMNPARTSSSTKSDCVRSWNLTLCCLVTPSR